MVASVCNESFKQECSKRSWKVNQDKMILILPALESFLLLSSSTATAAACCICVLAIESKRLSLSKEITNGANHWSCAIHARAIRKQPHP
jgi:hypothetical protein